MGAEVTDLEQMYTGFIDVNKVSRATASHSKKLF